MNTLSVPVDFVVEPFAPMPANTLLVPESENAADPFCVSKRPLLLSTLNPPVEVVVPTTDRARYGDVVPIPTLDPKYAIPVVVAPPLIVRPPVRVPLPIVELANAVKPFVITGVCVN